MLDCVRKVAAENLQSLAKLTTEAISIRGEGLIATANLSSGVSMSDV